MGQPGNQPSFAITLSIEGKMGAAKLVSWIKSARSLRTQFFDAELFADPAWDILLDLYGLELRQVRVKTSCVGLESGIPPPTRLRWLKASEHRGLIRRQSDPTDNRIVFISLSPAAIGIMDALFEAILAQRPDLQPP